jgi:hypothetical protein
MHDAAHLKERGIVSVGLHLLSADDELETGGGRRRRKEVLTEAMRNGVRAPIVCLP